MRQIIRFSAFLFLLTGGLSNQLPAQVGCTDPQADNYDPLATENDGSCTYPPTSLQADLIAELDPILTEASGLAFFNGQLWCQADGGNEDKVYRLDSLSGAIQHSTIIATADNIDWEDLAQNEDYLYIGDFGNNSGNRQDLAIHRVDQNVLSNTVVNADLITFSYEDQTNFSYQPFQTNFDCEAFFIYEDSIHLFTKQWLDYKTKHYVLPAEPGNHVAVLRDSFDVQLLITAADRSPEGNIVLLGWNPITGNAAMWMLFDYPEGAVFEGNKRRINLGFADNNAQPEGIVFSNDHLGWICSENYLNYPQRLLRFSIASFLGIEVSTSELADQSGIKVFPNPTSEELWIDLTRSEISVSELVLIDLAGIMRHRGTGLIRQPSHSARSF